MKKLMMIGAAGLAFAGFAGAQNDMLLTFSTPGPDTYMDGQTVLDGECYALVWSADGVFEGIKADGTPVDPADEVVLVGAVAKDGCCPPIVYQVSAAKAKDCGQYGVYLLDTRVIDAAGNKVVGGVAKNGKPAAVNAAAAVAEGAEVAEGSISELKTTAVGGAAITAYTQVDQPVITSIVPKGAKITLTVSGLSPVADYKVIAGGKPGEVSKEIDATVKDNTFEFDKGDETFFKVIGVRKIK